MRPLRWTTCILLVLALPACERASTGDRSAVRNDTALADTLRAIVADAYDFTRADVVARMTALYPDTGRVISASDGYLMDSADSVRAGIASFWDNVGRNMREPRWEWGTVHVDRLAADAAVMTATWSIPHIAPTERPHTIAGAWTAVFLRLDGEWKIIQEHLSIPPAR